MRNLSIYIYTASQLDLQPGSALKKARLYLPCNALGKLEWQDGSWAKSSVSFYDELYAMDAVSDTKKAHRIRDAHNKGDGRRQGLPPLR